MKLVTIAGPDGGFPGAILPSGDIVSLRGAAMAGTLESWLPRSLREILEAGPDGLNLVRALVDRVSRTNERERESLRARHVLLPAETRLMAPIPNPRFVLAAGLAYKSHLAEMSGTPTPPHPTGFQKSPDSITGPSDSVTIPHGVEMADYEGELAVVFGRSCHQVSPDKALDYVAGFTAANDLSARDWVKACWSAEGAWEARLTWEVNLMGKQFPGFTPLGPCLLTTDEIREPSDFAIETRVNDRVVQSASCADLIFSIQETISHFSRWYRFSPGDVLLTGTPAGVGAGRKPPLFLKPGDRVTVQISGIGTLDTLMRGEA